MRAQEHHKFQNACSTMTINASGTRTVRRLDDGAWTVLPDKELGRTIKLCNVCALKNECRIPQLIDGAKTLEMVVYRCNHYMIPVGFQRNIGLDGEFNTIRLGKKWLQRFESAREGGYPLRVGLVDAKRGTLIGKAVVTRVVTAEIDRMVKQYAPDNHTVKHLSADEAREKINVSLRKVYKMQMSENSIFSAVYMERINE